MLALLPNKRKRAKKVQKNAHTSKGLEGKKRGDKGGEGGCRSWSTRPDKKPQCRRRRRRRRKRRSIGLAVMKLRMRATNRT